MPASGTETSKVIVSGGIRPGGNYPTPRMFPGGVPTSSPFLKEEIGRQGPAGHVCIGRCGRGRSFHSAEDRPQRHDSGRDRKRSTLGVQPDRGDRSEHHARQASSIRPRSPSCWPSSRPSPCKDRPTTVAPPPPAQLAPPAHVASPHVVVPTQPVPAPVATAPAATAPGATGLAATVPSGAALAPPPVPALTAPSPVAPIPDEPIPAAPVPVASISVAPPRPPSEEHRSGSTSILSSQASRRTTRMVPPRKGPWPQSHP